MRIANRIAVGSGLLLTLLVAVLLYHIYQVRQAVRLSQELSEIHLQASALLLELGLLEQRVANLAEKFVALGDDAYADRLADLWQKQRPATHRLSDLDLGDEHRQAVRDLAGQWQRLEEFVGEVRSELPPEAPTQEGADTADLAADGLARAHSERLNQLLGRLHTQTDRVIRVTKESLEARSQRSEQQRRQAERVSAWVALVAAVLSIVLGSVTVRSINEPLRRLTRATRAVAEGRFDHQLETSRGDEFAALGGAFNSMVQRLGRLDQMKKDFVAHVSHEIKNPLVAMQETNQLLLEEIPGALSPQQRRLLELNVDSGTRLSAMLSNLLDMSRLEAGAVRYDFKAEDLRHLVTYVQTEFAARAREQGVSLEVEGVDGPVLALCDRERILQVLENLVENAIKFTPEGGRVVLGLGTLAEPPSDLPPPLARRLAPRSWRAYVLLTVADTGPGVEDGLKEAIFRKFHQVEGKRRGRHTGVGLGLAICREIVEAHQGAVWVADAAGGGSRFSVLLPAAPAADLRLGGTSVGEGRAV